MGRIVVPDLASAVASGQVPQLSCLANRSRNRCELVHICSKNRLSSHGLIIAYPIAGIGVSR
jgi:hypothetical protein